MNFIGIDMSLTGTGLIVLDDECKIIYSDVLSSDSKELIELRIIKLVTYIKEIVDNYGESRIYIEGLSFNSKGSSSLELSALHYYLRIVLYLGRIGYSIIPPTVLKKFVTGKGQVKKELMLLKVFMKFKVEFDNNNKADAYSLARLAEDDYRKGINRELY